jgi:hypothetical protein
MLTLSCAADEPHGMHCCLLGTGKTTLLRDIARLMSLPPAEGGLGLAVIIVDTSNEIAGMRICTAACLFLVEPSSCWHGIQLRFCCLLSVFPDATHDAAQQNKLHVVP